MSKLTAKRKLHSHGQQGNWRFKGMLLAALDPQVSADDMAKAWPTNSSDYAFLSEAQKRDRRLAPERKLRLDEDSDEYRQLSQVTKESDFKQLSDGTQGLHLDRGIKRMLFSADTYTEVDTLWREQLLDTVIMGAEPRKIARDATTVINVETRAGDHPRGSDQIFADEVSEGGQIRDDREDYDTVQWNCTKIAQGANVTEEMVDHALVDLIERHVSWLGAAVENTMNRIFLNGLVDNANNDFDTGGSDQGVPSLNGAITQVEVDNFMPDTAVGHPEYFQALFDDSNLAFANQAGSDDTVRNRTFNPLLGLEMFRASDNVYNSSSNTWGYGADGELGAVAYDRSRANSYVYKDIEIKDYEDPIRDLLGVNARAWYDFQLTQPDAASTVQF